MPRLKSQTTAAMQDALEQPSQLLELFVGQAGIEPARLLTLGF